MAVALEIWSPSGAKVVDIATRAVQFHATIAVSYSSNPSGSMSVPGLANGELVAFVISGVLGAGPTVTRSGTTLSWSGTQPGFSGTIWVGTY